MDDFKTIYAPSGEIASLVTNRSATRNSDVVPEYMPGPIGRNSEKMMRVSNMLSPFSQQFSISPFGFPGYADFPGQQMVSNIDTLSLNFRWYFVSNFRQHVSEAYVEYGLVRRAVDVPVDDAYRGGVTIKTDQLEEDEIKRLLIKMDRERDLNVASRTQKWGRLFGGGGTLLLVEDQDPREPLDIAAIKKGTKIEFRATDLWELFWDMQNSDGYDPSLQVPAMELFNYYGEDIHKSRVWRVNAFEIPSFVRPRFRGWGASMLEAIIRPLNQYLKHTDVTFEVLDEFKLDVYKIDGFMQALSTPEGEQMMMQRVRHANARKNFQHATVLDAKDDFQQRQLSFSGLGEVMQGIRIQLAAEMGMPLTKLFGLSATGFNAGEEDLENYNMMVEGTVRDDAKYLVLKMVELRCQQLFGFVPDDLTVEFKPLRVLGAVEEQNIKTQKATILDNARARNDISLKEYREAVNAGNLLDIKLDTSDELIAELESMQTAALDEGTMDTPQGGNNDDGGTSGGDKPAAASKGGMSKGNEKPGKNGEKPEASKAQDGKPKAAKERHE